MDMNLWMEKARTAILRLPAKKPFELRDLFQGCEWETLSKGERIQFGKHFKGEVLDGRVKKVEFITRAINNHAKYQRIEEEK